MRASWLFSAVVQLSSREMFNRSPALPYEQHYWRFIAEEGRRPLISCKGNVSLVPAEFAPSYAWFCGKSCGKRGGRCIWRFLRHCWECTKTIIFIFQTKNVKVPHLSRCVFFGTFSDGIWNTDTCVPHVPIFMPIEPRGAEKRANPKNVITHKSYIASLVGKALFARSFAIFGHEFHVSKRSGWKENPRLSLAFVKSKRARKCKKLRFSHANTLTQRRCSICWTRINIFLKHVLDSPIMEWKHIKNPAAS